MKLIKCKVYIDRTGNLTSYSGGYPAGWDAPRIPFILYLYKSEDEGQEANGRIYQWVIACVPDDTYDVLIKSNQSQAITNTEAIQWSDKYMPRKEWIKDQSLVLKSIIKKIRNLSLTQSEIDTLDPDKGTGLAWSKSAVEIWRDYGVSI